MRLITYCRTTFFVAVAFLVMNGIANGQSPITVDKGYEKEIKKLASQKSVVKAFEIIDKLEPETSQDLIRLTEIPAPPFKETRRAEEFKRLLEKAGADKVWIDEVGNVLALKKGRTGRRTIALDAHMDTVFPEETDVTIKYRGDTLYAPGIGDDTRGLAMVLAILKSINQSSIATNADVLFVGTVGEEGLGDLRGVKHLFKDSKIKIDTWISIDGGKIGRINNAALGSKRYKTVFKGKGGHSWGAFGLANPHHALGYAIKDFVITASRFTSEGPKTSFNVGRIGGGTSVNSIPFESWMEVDMRSVSVSRLGQLDSIFKASMRKSLKEYNSSGVKGSVDMELIKIGDRPSGEVSVETPLVQRALAVTNFFGAKARLTRGSTNGNIPISMGIPAVTIGRGGHGGSAHSLGEWWLNKNGAEAIKLALLLTLAEAELAK